MDCIQLKRSINSEQGNFMQRTYCTYFDRNYLIKGLALISSLIRHETAPFTLYVVCLDEITRVILDRLNIAKVITVPLHQIEQGDEQLAIARGNRSLVEYYWTMTPTIIVHLLDKVPQGDVLTYLDADLFFYSSPEPIFSELAGHSILIHEHRFTPSLQWMDMHGIYNVGLLCFRNDGRARVVLDWWRKRCNEWCYARIEDGKFGDQLYLNDWTERFEGVHVLEHIGAGVAPWNHEQYHYSVDATGRPCVDGLPIVFYHFHALSVVAPEIIVPAKHINYPMREEVLKLCVASYVDSLSLMITIVRDILPEYSFGISDLGELKHEHTFVAIKEAHEMLRQLGFVHKTFELENGWECYISEQTTYPLRNSF